MSVLGLGHRAATRGVVSVPAGRLFQVTPAFDVWISVSAAGDALERDFHFALLKANKTYSVILPAAGGPYVLSGVTTDPNGDASPTQLTYVDGGPSGI